MFTNLQNKTQIRFGLGDLLTLTLLGGGTIKRSSSESECYDPECTHSIEVTIIIIIIVISRVFKGDKWNCLLSFYCQSTLSFHFIWGLSAPHPLSLFVSLSFSLFLLLSLSLSHCLSLSAFINQKLPLFSSKINNCYLIMPIVVAVAAAVVCRPTAAIPFPSLSPCLTVLLSQCALRRVQVLYKPGTAPFVKAARIEIEIDQSFFTLGPRECVK